jgi:hypothetical protein
MTRTIIPPSVARTHGSSSLVRRQGLRGCFSHQRSPLDVDRPETKDKDRTLEIDRHVRLESKIRDHVDAVVDYLAGTGEPPL